MTVSDPISLSTLVAQLGLQARRFDVDVLASCDSSNAVLLARAEAGAPSGTVVAAEEQTAGRGRRGRQWLSSPGDSLMFSLLWRFPAGTTMAGLSLAVGVAVVSALEKHGDAEFELKWPNDILREGKKLGGILIEMMPGAANVAVMGIGLNRRLPQSLPDEVRACATDIGGAVEIHALLATLLIELAAVLDVFAAKGFTALRADWLRRHAYQDVPVRLSSDFVAPQEGICRGVDADGALLLEIDGCVQRIISGEVTLRLAS